MKKKQNPNQLTLDLEARPYQIVINIAAPTTATDIFQGTRDEAEEVLRAAIRKQVGILMLTKGWTYHQAYVTVYAAFDKRTGTNPTVRSQELGLKTHLDVVFRMARWPRIMMQCINDLIRDRRASPVVA